VGSVTADWRYRKQSQPVNDDYQRLLIENLVAANQEATRNFHTLLKTIGPANETSNIAAASTSDLSIGGSTIMAQEVQWDQEHPKSLSTMEANSGRQRAPDTNKVEHARDIPASDDDRSVDKFAISDKYSATETTMACLKRIQQALDQFEASEENLKSASQIAVSIEVFKHISYSDFQARKRKPWEVASIARRLNDKELEAGLSDIVGVKREDIKKVILPGEKLDALQDKTDNLSSSSQAFKRGANRPREQQGWLSTLNRAWQNLPSAKNVTASTDKFFQK
jgi:Synaptobrevin